MQPKIKGKRVILRKPRFSDVNAITEICQDKIISRWTRVPYNYKKSDAIKFVKQSKKTKQTKDHIYVIEHEEVMGAIHITQKDTTGEIGYFIGQKYRNKGYATEAVKLIIKEGFKKLKINKIIALTFIGNKASEKVLTNAGMSYTKIIKNHIKKGNKYYGVKEYTILREDI